MSGSAPKLTNGRRPRRLMSLVGLGLMAAACFFAGRRIYYRMLQTDPPWLHRTPTEEEIVAADGLQISLWADASLIHNPTALSVDAQGRLWVAEAVDYRVWQNHQDRSGDAFEPEGDRIVILEDTDDDGKADSVRTFVRDRDLVAPTGLCVIGNRVYVACSPHVLVFIDDDGDDHPDRREILLTGFGGRDHDHGVHSIVPGPDGRIYLSVGNAGPHHITDRSGRTFHVGSVVQNFAAFEAAEEDSSEPDVINTGGLVSDDGNIYVGGFVCSVEPDGTDLRIHAHNCRNPYDVAVDSGGNLWQTDNDDTAACRMSWLMDGASLGFTSRDGTRTWQSDQRPDQPIPGAHWHQADPGVLPAGDIYGTGAPTGLVRCESSVLGDDLKGCLIAADAGLGCVFAFQPFSHGAGYRFQQRRLVWSEPRGEGHSPRSDGLAATWFRPSDVAFGTEGELFIADWYDSFVGSHHVNDRAAEGRIYRLTRAEGATERRSRLDEPESAGMRLNSDVPEIRWNRIPASAATDR
ncbi:MAG: hypothetical protein KDA96_08535, partial [Planctomycetaceae bacterium]|nr:hypothetical protein [Planctomycetaceae bacterium]